MACPNVSDYEAERARFTWEEGIVAPAIHDADRLSLDELMAKLRDLVGRARAGVLQSSEVSDPTITVTNLGDLGMEAVFGVIYPSRVALVGFGRVIERPWARAGMLGVRRCHDLVRRTPSERRPPGWPLSDRGRPPHPGAEKL